MAAEKSFFSTGVSAFFEMSTADASRILPPHLQPIEIRPQRSILNVSAFHFHESEVGPYAELMFSVVVPPVVDAWGRHPKAAFFPFQVATSSEESRLHRSKLRCIPHLTEDIDAQFIEKSHELRVKIWAGGAPVVDLTVTEKEWQDSTHLLHAFMMDGDRRLKVAFQLTGHYTVHEQERGRITLSPHPMTADITIEDVSPYPFREHWLKEGFEVFDPVETL